VLVVCIVGALSSGCSFRDEQPRGSDILYVRDEAKGSAIYLMSDDGREVRRLVEGNAARWSPDGTRILYRVDEMGDGRYHGTSLWVLNPETGEKRRVVRGDLDGGVYSFGWAPDGVRIAYSNLTRVFILNTETYDLKLFSIEGLVDGPLDWSPDGREIIVSAHLSSKILDVRTGAEREIAPEAVVGHGRWSPDGEQIALAQVGPLPQLKRFIVVVERDGGSNSKRVTTGPDDSEPSWSPDGGQMYFTRNPAGLLTEDDEKLEIYRIDLETRSLSRLTENDVPDRSPDPRPARHSLPDPPETQTGEVVVPDLVGRHILFENEQRRFEKLGLQLMAVLFSTDHGVLAVVEEQAPRAGSRVPKGTIVKLAALDLGGLYARGVFSAQVWKANSDCKTNAKLRGPMYVDLIRRVLRKGMSKERVLSFLGDPERSEGRMFDWPLGRTSYVAVDCIYLRVAFDRRGQATRFYQKAN